MQPPGYNFWPLKLLGTGKAITKQCTAVSRTKKRTKEPTEENQRKPAAEENKRKKSAKASRKVVKRLWKVEREQHPRNCDSAESAGTMMLLADPCG